MTNVTIVAGVLEVELYLRGNISQEILQGMFKRALAAAVEIPLEFIVKLDVSESKQALGIKRRLQENQTNQTTSHDNYTKVYDVAYEIIVPDYMDADKIIEKANRIAEPGSDESQLFRQVLLETDGVVGVGSIVSKVSAYKVGDKVTSVAPTSPPEEDDDDEIWKVWVIGLSIAFVVVVILASSVILIKRKVFPVETGNPDNAKAGDIENARLELVNEKVVTDEPRATEAPQAVLETPAPTPAPAPVSSPVKYDVPNDQAPVEPSPSKRCGMDKVMDNSRPIQKEAHLVPEGIHVSISECKDSSEPTATGAAALATTAVKTRTQFYV